MQLQVAIAKDATDLNSPYNILALQVVQVSQIKFIERMYINLAR